ncbi:hypothetical protein X777_09722 [Ooceraea biroi]|uniref:Uncharacterized protein n=1 Tax=Ooceraea biroi TaxID=2015173 RepID=A0A026W620_OOCBI|nr:hypothetical protein X777_09722 [Ooceraea biroi]
MRSANAQYDMQRTSSSLHTLERYTTSIPVRESEEDSGGITALLFHGWLLKIIA